MHRNTHRRRLLLKTFVRLALATVLTSITLSTCTGLDSSWKAAPSQRAPYYDSDCFSLEGGRAVFEDDTVIARTTGIDVSDHQGLIDWTAVAADGISFALIRVGYRGNTEGYLHQDERFEENLAGAEDAGLACGIYFYSQAVTVEEAREEAAFVLERLGSRELAYPIVFDYELNSGGRLASLGDYEATACARAFCETIQASGHDCMLYGNGYDLQRLDLAELPDCPVWYAEYSGAPSRTDSFVLWQYTASGSVNGIATPVDLDLDLSAALQASQGAS